MATDDTDFRQRIARNKRATLVLLTGFFLLLATVCSVVALAIGGGIIVAGIGTIAAFAIAWVSYRNSDRLALSSTGATPADPAMFAQLHNVVEEMSIAAGIPKPRVFVVNDPAPNAFATGRDPDHAAVAVTTGLLEKLNRDELQGVMAHELAHIRNYDIRIMTVAVATAGSIALITDLAWRLLWLGGGRSRNKNANPLALLGLVVVGFLAPLAAAMLKAAISRQREGLADASAIEFTRHPTGLRKALEKLDADSTVVRRTSHATSHLWIESPDTHEPQERGRWINNMFDTHPPLRERIDVLRAMEGLPAYTGPDPTMVAELRERAATDAARRGLDGAFGRSGSSAWDTMTAQSGAAASPSGAAPGWYPDPSGVAKALRFWDGTSWTAHLHRP